MRAARAVKEAATSILNIVLIAEAALVCIDTDVRFAPTGEHIGHTSKLIPLVHLNAVLAYRGALLFFARVIGGCLFPVKGFDELVEALPSLLGKCYSTFRDSELRLLQPGRELADQEREILDCQEVSLVGWSRKRERIVGYRWLQESPSSGFEELEITVGTVGPLIPNMPEPDFVHRASMMAYARIQRAWIREHRPLWSGGGNLVIVEIRRDRMSIEQACDLEAIAGTPAAEGWHTVVIA